MKFNKVILILIISLLAIPTVSSASFAGETNNCFIDESKGKKIMLKNSIPSSQDELFEKAKNKSSYLNQEVLTKNLGKAELVNEEQNKTIELDILATSELLEKYEIDGKIYEKIAITEFATIENNILTDSTVDKTQANLVVAASSSEDPGSQWDDSISVKISSTNYYTKSGNCIKLTNVAGKWESFDRNVTIGTKTVYMGQRGTLCSTGGFKPYVSSYYYPNSSNSYSYAAPSTWQSVNIKSENARVSHFAITELTRFSTKWTFVYENLIPSDV
jgi:hypothetical protein